ncbi:MAG: HyaD/HybD family hydrogenase maturation endopeptidase [Rhodocyclaceae bacterium]|nr:HyaD/HybD family hydrogenase maturation endopeptidase [Rhodocyclaceae bacterium]
MKGALVLGIGNVLMGDDGLGVAAIAALQRDYALPTDVEVLDGGTAGMELLEALEDRDFLLIADAIDAREAPGTLIRLAGEEVPIFFRRNLSPHGIGFADALAALEWLGRMPKEVVVLGLQPQSIALSTELSPTVKARLPALVTGLVQELGARGWKLASLPAGASV